ncbi:monothiol bacilliredoxin BrxC family protein [Deinococcus humi]|uniref:Bacillithiol system protein YtxJ n=1 Tax=Deinococcus humi TaxID=662880 RepID=A0A7W8JTU0_9DEIO|nr:monothiol bacilliredoxin BrxC family protein [Deinococcus humi]MBB5361833.1 bacillithiol system protein YtxJ [Deinococcus humi]GGO23414.1 thioredoxin [Deinococcus humi]
MTQSAPSESQAEKQVLVPLTTPEEVDQFLTDYPLAAVFKAGTCHKTMQGFGVLETFLQDHELPVGFIRVVDWRPASNHVAQLTGIVHHSPQLMIFKDGQVQFEVNNWDITPEALEPVFAQVPARSAPAGVQTDDNIEPYRRLMRDFVDGKISDWAFQDQYVTMFRDDASLRSQREFELLSRLFGDPDAYHGGLHQLGQPQERGNLKDRVQQLLTELG